MDSVFTIAGTIMRIHLPAEIDHHVSEQLCGQIDWLVQRKHIRCILFDFADTTFMDSAGAGMLIGRYKTMRFMGGNAIAVNVSRRMERVLSLAGIDRIMDIYATVPSGL